MPRGSDFTGSLTPGKVDANCSCEIIQPDLRSPHPPPPAPEARLRGSLPSHQRNGPLSCWGTAPSPRRQKEKGHKPPASSLPPQIAQREFSDSRLALSLEQRISDTGREGYLERRCLDYKVKLGLYFPSQPPGFQRQGDAMVDPAIIATPCKKMLSSLRSLWGELLSFLLKKKKKIYFQSSLSPIFNSQPSELHEVPSQTYVT